MKQIFETDVPVTVKGSFVSGFGWQEIKAGQNHFGPAGASALFCFTSSDLQMHLYVKIYNKIRYWRSISNQGVLITKVLHLKIDDIWVTTGSDFKLYKWNV